MQNNSRAFVSVVGTVAMVVMTVTLAAWAPPETPAEHTADEASSSVEQR